MVMGEGTAPSKWNLDQERANYAYNCVEKISAKKMNYRSLIRKVPSYILTNGLAQTIVFLKSKADGNDEHKQVYNHINEWIRQRLGKDQNFDLLKWVTGAKWSEYRLATMEALAIAGWLARFSEAILKEGETR